MTHQFTPYEDITEVWRAKVEDRGIAKDLRSHLIEDCDGEPQKLRELSDDVDRAGPSRVARIIEHWDWFEHIDVDGANGIRITQAGHQSLREDADRLHPDQKASSGARDVREVTTRGGD